jgi:hypothetical protein
VPWGCAWLVLISIRMAVDMVSYWLLSTRQVEAVLDIVGAAIVLHP